MASSSVIVSGHWFRIEKEEEAYKAKDGWTGHSHFATRTIWNAYSAATGKSAGATARTRKQCIENLNALSPAELARVLK